MHNAYNTFMTSYGGNVHLQALHHKRALTLLLIILLTYLLIGHWLFHSFADRSFATAGQCLWNTLMSTLRQMISYGQFR